jgi:ribosomal protein S18 acetylase RimI-like enzyme
VQVRAGSWDDFDAVAAITGEPTRLRPRWDLPSFDPERHLWLADGAYGALFAPDEAVVRGNAELIPALLARIEARAREEGRERLAFVIPDWDVPAWTAYEAYGFALAAEVLEMEVLFDDPPPESPPPGGSALRSYTDADADAVRSLLDEAYAAWDEAYVPLAHEDWLSYMTDHDSFDPQCWFLAEEQTVLVGVCLTWREGWIKDIAVVERARGRGLGEALLRHAFARLYERGVRRVGLKVDSANPTGAVRLYARAGMRTVKRHRHYVKKL